MAGGGVSGRIVVWDAGSGKQLRRFDRCPGVETVAFTADGYSLVSSSRDGTVRLWEVATGKERLRWTTGVRGEGTLVAVSSEGRMLAAETGSGVEVWDVTGLAGAAPARLTADRFAALWGDLGGEDAAAAHRAVRKLASSSPEPVPLIRERLRPVKAPDPEAVALWIAQLDAEDFTAREKASAALEEAGELADGAVRRALAATTSAERRRRLERAAESLRASVLRGTRAVEVLDLIGTREARDVLSSLSKGDPHGELTRRARAALEGLDRRKDAAPLIGQGVTCGLQAISNARTVPSSPAEYAIFSSGDVTTAQTVSLCPGQTRFFFLFGRGVSNARTIQSSPALTTRRPSGTKAVAATSQAWRC